MGSTSLLETSFREYLTTKAHLLKQTRAKRELRRPAESDWRGWLDAVFAGYVRPPFAPYHEAFWRFAMGIRAGVGGPAFVAIWPRGFGKSTSVEVLAALVAARRTRSYVLYVSATQSQANDHVQNVAAILESETFAKYFPATARRKVGKYGSSQGWRRNRLRTEDGFTVDAIGLDTAARGAKIENVRPDLIIVDDVDELLDSPATIRKKIELLTKSVLQSRADHAVVVIAQNLIHANGIVAQLADGRATFLADRIVSGPHKAIEGLETERREMLIDGEAKECDVIVAGVSTWEAKSLDDLQATINDVGISAFLSEQQQDVDEITGSMFEHIVPRRIKRSDLPDLEAVECWVDPSISDTKRSDSHGIQIDGVADDVLYRLYSWEKQASPEIALEHAILMAREYKARLIGIETDQGGDTWISTYRQAWQNLVKKGSIPKGERMLPMKQAKAGAIGSKTFRAEQMLAAYERDEIVHVDGTSHILEKAMKRYLRVKPYDLVDAAFWGWRGLTTKRRKAAVH